VISYEDPIHVYLDTRVRYEDAVKSARPGVHFLVGAVDPITFMAELKKACVEQAENFTPYTS
jgi:hypothetical protein